jgi:hypothetical protein
MNLLPQRIIGIIISCIFILINRFYIKNDLNPSYVINERKYYEVSIDSLNELNYLINLKFQKLLS